MGLRVEIRMKACNQRLAVERPGPSGPIKLINTNEGGGGQVCVTCCSRDAMLRIDHICHQNGIKFFAGDVFGYHGYAFADLGEHDFVECVFWGQKAPFWG